MANEKLRSLQVQYARTSKDYALDLSDIIEAGTRVPDPDETPYYYTESTTDGDNKFTEDATKCLVVILTGDAPDGTPLSKIIHASPPSFRTGSNFRYRYPIILQEFSERTQDDSRTAVVAGGVYAPFPFDVEHPNPFDGRKYPHALRYLSSIHNELLRCSTYALPPKNDWSRSNTETAVYLNTPERTLYVVENSKKGDGQFRPAEPSYARPRRRLTR